MKLGTAFPKMSLYCIHIYAAATAINDALVRPERDVYLLKT